MRIVPERPDVLGRRLNAYFVFAQTAGIIGGLLVPEGTAIVSGVVALTAVAIQAGIIAYYIPPKAEARWYLSFFLFFSNAAASIIAGAVAGVRHLDGTVAFVVAAGGWLLTAVIAGVGICLSAISSRVFTLIRRFPRPGECLYCGYNLTGNTSGRCPECGQPLDGRS